MRPDIPRHHPDYTLICEEPHQPDAQRPGREHPLTAAPTGAKSYRRGSQMQVILSRSLRICHPERETVASTGRKLVETDAPPAQAAGSPAGPTGTCSPSSAGRARTPGARWR